MARAPKRSTTPGTEFLQVRLDGDLKNQIIDLCVEQECSLNGWLVEVIKRALREGQGLPEPPPAVAPLPTPQKMLQDYLSGEQTLAPCGKPAPCEGMQVEPFQHDGMSFCAVCHVRTI